MLTSPPSPPPGRGSPIPLPSIRGQLTTGSFGLRIDSLWFLGALAGFGILISLAPQPPHDFWWHLKIGEIIHSTRTIPATNLFGWTLDAQAPFQYGAWLAEWLFFMLYRWGGVPLLLFSRTCLALFAFGMLGFEAYRRSRSWRTSGVLTALAGLMAANNLIVRPQNWSWIPFIAFLILLSAYIDRQLRGRWLFLCPLLMAFWVNVHGSFVLGLVLFGIFFAGESLRTLLHLESHLSWREVAWIGVVGLLTSFAMLANPNGGGIAEYVVKLMTDQPSQTLIAEWQSPNPHDLGSLFFFIGQLILIGVFAYKRYRPTPSEILLLLAFLWLAWSGVRYVVWFGMVATPILARCLKDIGLEKTWTIPASRHPLNSVLAVIFFLPLGLLQPWWIERVPLPDTYWARVWKGAQDGPLLSVHTPLGAASYLRQHPGGRLFNEMGYGSYLIWTLPEQGVFIDPRVELYPYSQWMDYIKISNGVRYNSLLEGYRIDRLLLDREAQAELIELLENDPLWQKEYGDGYAQIWKKRTP